MVEAAKNVVNENDLEKQIAEFEAKSKQLAELKKQAKKNKKAGDWEAKTLKKNSALVSGSLRVATQVDREALGHVHGAVCDIKCVTCGELRVVNKQDAFQVRHCTACREKAKRTKMKAARLQKRADNMSLGDIEAQIAEFSKLASVKKGK